MSEPAVMERPVPGLSVLAQQVLPVLYQHRLVSTRQLHTLLQPHAQDSRYLRRELKVLRERGLAAATERRAGRPGGRELLSYVTPLGCEVVEAAGEVPHRAYRISARAAAGQLQEHTLAVNDVGTAFVAWARAAGDECGPLDWEAERAHRMRDGEDRLSDRAFLVPDAVLRYTRTQGQQRRLFTCFLELDRGTEHASVLVSKIAAYARYYRYTPSPSAPAGRGRAARTGSGLGGGGEVREAWRERYPQFPTVLIVLTGRSERVLARRAADVRALVAADERLERAAAPLQIGITTLDQLTQHGPLAPIVTPLDSARAAGPQVDVLFSQEAPRV